MAENLYSKGLTGYKISNAIEFYNFFKEDFGNPEWGYETYMNFYIGFGVFNLGEISCNDVTTMEEDTLTFEIPCKPQDCLITVKYANQETVFKIKIDQYEIAMFGAYYEDRYVAIDTVGKKMLKIESVEAFEYDADEPKGFELVDSPLYGVNYFSITYYMDSNCNIKRLKLITNEAVIDKYFYYTMLW